MKHTPGSWKVTKGPAECLDIRVPGSLICRVLGPNEPQDTPNAQLIAASPKLLKALKAAFELMECLEWNGDAELQEEWENCLADSKKAIAKAEGES